MHFQIAHLSKHSDQNFENDFINVSIHFLHQLDKNIHLMIYSKFLS